VLTDVVVVIVVVVGVADVVIPTSSGDVTKLEVDERLDKRVGSIAGRLKTLSRRANGLLCGPPIVMADQASNAIMRMKSTARQYPIDIARSTLTHSQCDAGNIAFCNFCCFRCASR